MPDFVWHALLGGMGVACVAGPLGCFVVWRRMAYFGDTLSHSALLGVALGFLLGIDLRIGILVVCLLAGLLLVAMHGRQRLASDTLLGIIAHTALSLGMVTIAFLPSLRIDLMGYLFGDILAISQRDLLTIALGGLMVLIALANIWRGLLSATVHEDLARVEGVPTARNNLIFVLLLALVVAVAMKVVGMLLITALLIIPAATARRFAGSPERMALLAALVGILAVAGGVFGSLRWDTPAGPSIVVAATILFMLAFLLPVMRRESVLPPRRL
ncbi:hypothetical protein BI364_03325 [Acidihalobacter yilgarnensis]|uniref:High-affinity zinc uptake system membrane protein ZnuB n=2 Tax=Acidihalobacter yilgarnensis TaxID=2819280 RepID=A0A1D8IL91_9GAMM|nr:zinc ABC transporter permease subunit ZnuB [Acidihalobacter yilgarnensis]AOU97161.1 hypothetical protein BI364_03325 [Acidihalobacter yilgarnensis]